VNWQLIEHKDGEQPPLLMVRPQFIQHDELHVYGNRDGLKVLRDALDIAISLGCDSMSEWVCAPDGEGYHVEINLDNSHWQGESWQKRVDDLVYLFPWGDRRCAECELWVHAKCDNCGESMVLVSYEGGRDFGLSHLIPPEWEVRNFRLLCPECAEEDS